MSVRITPEYESVVQAEYDAMFRVRDYTEEEQEIIDWDVSTPSERIKKIICVNHVNHQRYEEVKRTNPEMATHMTMMQAASLSFVNAMVKIYEQEHGVTFDETGAVDVSHLPGRQFPTIIDPEFINRPA